METKAEKIINEPAPPKAILDEIKTAPVNTFAELEAFVPEGEATKVYLALIKPVLSAIKEKLRLGIQVTEEDQKGLIYTEGDIADKIEALLAKEREIVEREKIAWAQTYDETSPAGLGKTAGKFIYPVLKRMYAAVRQAGKYVFIHSCGDVDELFEDLIAAGVNCFNPFQPEVMDIFALHERYRGRLTFHGGLSTQRTLPFGSAADVRRETDGLLEMGSAGSYILAPAHDVEGDIPLQNMLTFIEAAQAQPGYLANS